MQRHPTLRRAGHAGTGRISLVRCKLWTRLALNHPRRHLMARLFLFHFGLQKRGEFWCMKAFVSVWVFCPLKNGVSTPPGWLPVWLLDDIRSKKLFEGSSPSTYYKMREVGAQKVIHSIIKTGLRCYSWTTFWGGEGYRSLPAKDWEETSTIVVPASSSGWLKTWAGHIRSVQSVSLVTSCYHDEHEQYCPNTHTLTHTSSIEHGKKK